MLQRIARRVGGALKGGQQQPVRAISSSSRRLNENGSLKDSVADSNPELIQAPKLPVIGFVGGNGNLAGTLLENYEKQGILASSRSEAGKKALRDRKGVTVLETPQLAQESDVIMLFSKPKDTEAALKELGKVKKNALIISFVAAYPVAALRRPLANRGDVGIVRAMTGLGGEVVCLHLPKNLSEAHKNLVRGAFPGKEIIEIEDQRKFEAATVFLGCFPGVAWGKIVRVALLAEQYGIPQKALFRTLKKAAESALKEENPTFEAEVNKVKTPGGITEGMLKELNDEGVLIILPQVFQRAVRKCENISQEREAASELAKPAEAKVSAPQPSAPSTVFFGKGSSISELPDDAPVADTVVEQSSLVR